MPAGRKGAEYMRRRRAQGKAWDQRPENREQVRKRKRRYRANNLEKVRKRDLDYYHRADGGWSKRRTRDLAAQRSRVEGDLRLLEEERKAIERAIEREAG
jgi:hypothetical protein